MSNFYFNDHSIFEDLIENNFDAFWSVDLRDGAYKLEYVNKAAEEILGYSLEDVFTQSDILSKLVHPDDSKLDLDAIQRCLDNGFSEVRYRLFHKNGKIKWIYTRRKLIRDESGKPCRMLGSSTDVTDATYNELKRKESEELFQSLAMFAPIGIFKTDLLGFSTYTNSHWQQIAGCTFEESLGLGWTKNIHPADIDRVAATWHQATSQNQDYICEFRFINPFTGERIVSSRAAPIIGSEGIVVGFVGTTEDITERRQAEAKMSSLGEMASGIAHEINNPLMIITGTCSKIRRIFEGRAELNCEKEISKIEATAFRISKIIKGLKSFSRNAENDVKEQVTLNRLIEDSFELCEQRFENENVQIKKSLNGLGELQVNVRPTQVVQVLLNLLSNAYDATEKLADRWVEVFLEKSGRSVVLKVIDSGLGIPEQVIEKMMEPFFTTKEVGKGTGLGLSISRGIMEENGGKLSYQRGPHTCFCIEFFDVIS